MSFFAAIPALATNPGPLYIQLERILRDAILDGSLKESYVLPTEREMAEHYGISRITVRKALTDLHREGLLTRRRGAGTFVSPRIESAPSTLTPFSEDIVSSAKGSRSVWIEREMDAVTPDESMALGLAPGAQVYRFKRVRYTETMPIAVETSTVPWYCLASELAVEGSLYAALKAGGHPPTRALQRLRAVALSAPEAALLKVEPGTAGLFIERRGFLSDGRTAELTTAWYRGDASDLVAEINIPLQFHAEDHA